MSDTDLFHGVVPPRRDEERIPTGVAGFDPLLEGGFPAGSLITIAGRPGTGKTIFSSQFLHQGGLEYGQPGMYVSMLEGRRAYLRNMGRLGFDFEALEAKGLFRFLEMPTLTAEGLPAIWEEIVKNIYEQHTVRLVIDSFTAMAQVFQSQADVRIFTHILLGKITSGAGCTTLMITELPSPNGGTGGVEEFIADGVIHFYVAPVGDGRIRYLEITKMRGTAHQMGPIPIEIGRRGIVVRNRR